MFSNLNWMLYRCHLEISIHYHRGDPHASYALDLLLPGCCMFLSWFTPLFHWVITTFSSSLKVQRKGTMEVNEFSSCMSEKVLFYPHLMDSWLDIEVQHINYNIEVIGPLSTRFQCVVERSIDSDSLLFPSRSLYFCSPDIQTFTVGYLTLGLFHSLCKPFQAGNSCFSSDSFLVLFS